MKILNWTIGRKAKEIDAKEKSETVTISHHDPLDPLSKIDHGGWKPEEFSPISVTIDSYPVHTPVTNFATDSKAVDTAVKSVAMDDSDIVGKGQGLGINAYTVPVALQAWYNAQSFIGYQACAIIAQHWLVDKACSQSGDDAIRNGWELKADGSQEVSDDQLTRISEIDIELTIKDNLAEFSRFKNIFGIRVALFIVESDDEHYYEKPFNIDGILEGSYKGISQVDPYWMTPMMTSESTSNPASKHFYDPEYWVISGKKYHRSHLIIGRGPQPADILKPTYIFGGIPLTQRIYERVYAAERTANEAPLLALNKRTTAIHVDVEKAIGNESKFLEKLMFWVKYRDNHAVKVLGKDETMEQFDTSLADFDAVIMNQYQLVAAIAKTPSTKLLGTSPKGFNATGEFEAISYHEELESIQKHVMGPVLDRHYLLLMKSQGMDIKLHVVWNPVDSITTQQLAELNDKKADTDQKNITIGAISPDEVRQRLRDDKSSGYNRLTDDEANEKPGMSPENLAAFEKAGAESEKGGAASLAANAKAATAGVEPTDSEGNAPPALEKAPDNVLEGDADAVEPKAEAKKADPANALVLELIDSLKKQIESLEELKLSEGVDIQYDAAPGIKRSVKPSVDGITPNVSGAGSLVGQKDTSEMPKIKIAGLITCIENPRGSIRQGKNGDWKMKMAHHYGFIKGVQGADSDEMDCFIGPELKSNTAFVINQVDKSGSFDEHKVMLGFNSEAKARQGYADSYSAGWDGLGSIHKVSIADLKAWMESGDTSAPFEG